MIGLVGYEFKVDGNLKEHIIGLIIRILKEGIVLEVLGIQTTARDIAFAPTYAKIS